MSKVATSAQDTVTMVKKAISTLLIFEDVIDLNRFATITNKLSSVLDKKENNTDISF